LAQTISERFNSTTIFMLRPGYRGNFGKSDGYANREDDDYSKENVEYMAGALRGLRQAHSGKKVVMVGHSGGSAMTALLLAFHPELIEAVVLAGCPCDVGPWRRRRAITAHRSDIPWTNSLSPLDNTKQVSKQAVVIAITGENDNNTVPQFSQAYISGPPAQWSRKGAVRFGRGRVPWLRSWRAGVFRGNPECSPGSFKSS
jgi:pimeloyl-ACP methyl ester carboxylesterase